MLLYYRAVVMSQACRVFSKLQQRIGSLRKSDLLDPNGTVRENFSLKPLLCFKKPNGIHKFSIVTFPLPHPVELWRYMRDVKFSGLKVETSNMTCYYPIFWTSHKQRRLCYRSYETRIIAALNANDCVFYLKQIF